MERGKLVVIDGVDGSGKGTQIRLLQENFRNVLFTREPGGTPFAEHIRELLLSVNEHDLEDRTPFSDFLMFWAAREMHVQNCIIPALEKGQCVISDRFDSSTCSFQLHGEENLVLLDLFHIMREQVLKNCEPNLYIILDLPPEVSLKRLARDNKHAKTRFDLRDIAYHERVRKGFKCFAEIAHCKFIDANRSVEEVYRDVREAFSSI